MKAYCLLLCMSLVWISTTRAQEAIAPNQTRPPSQHAGFQIGIGVGAGTVVDLYEPGLVTQFMIGGGLSDQLRLYYYALNHWYSQSISTSDEDGNPIDGESEFRILFINGMGADYFFLPRVALRLALGVGGDVIFDRSRDAEFSQSGLGIAYAVGMSFELLGRNQHLTLDPVINIVSFDVRKTVKKEVRSGGHEWKSYPVFGLVLAYSYH